MDLNLSRSDDDSSNEEISGLLYKRRGGFGKHAANAWQLRYFTIKDGVMYYYEGVDDNNKHPRGKIDLKYYGCRMQCGTALEQAPTPFTIQIIPGTWEEKWKLCAENEAIFQRWLDVIEKYVANKSRSMSPSQLNVTDDITFSDDDIGNDNEDMVHSTPPRGLGSLKSSSGDIGTVTAAAAPATPPPHLKNTDSTKNSLQVDTNESQLPPVPLLSPSALERKKKKQLIADLKDMFKVLVISNLCFIAGYISESFTAKVVILIITNAVIFVYLFKSARKRRNSIENQHASSTQTAGHLSKHHTIASPIILQKDINNFVLPGQTLVNASGKKKPNVIQEHSWNNCNHKLFSVRMGPDYHQNRYTAPSGTSLYEAFGVDIFRLRHRVDHIAKHIKLPSYPDLLTNSKHVPSILVINIQIPINLYSIASEGEEDDHCWSVLLYFKITQETCVELKRLDNASAAVKLLAQYCKKSDTDSKWRSRLKMMASATTSPDMNVDSSFIKFQGTPDMIGGNSSVYRGENYLEIDINAFQFKNKLMQTLQLLSFQEFHRWCLQLGFVIEGREDFELPENLLGCVGIHQIVYEKLVHLFVLDEN